jgi:hypothetical protein
MKAEKRGRPSSEHEQVYHASGVLSSRFASLDSTPLAWSEEGMLD